MHFRDDISVIVETLAQAHFGSYEEGKDFYEFDNDDDGEVNCLAEAFSDSFETDVRYFVGATKAVFDNPERDYVIKIPFNGGEQEHSSEYSDEDGEICYGSEYRFEKFEYADHDSGIGSSWDYCEQEEIIYNRAVALGIGDMFAGTVKIADVHNYPIYASERAESYSQVDYGSTSSSETVRHIFSAINQHDAEESELYQIGEQFMEECEETEEFSSPDRMNLEFLGYMINYYGKGKVRTLCEFLFENRLNDFHSSNVGFIGDRPVLIDYSGFFEYM